VGSGAYRPVYAVTETSGGFIWISSSTLTQYDPQTGQTNVVVPERDTSAETPDASHSQFGVVTSPGQIGPVFEAADGAIWYNDQFNGLVRWDRTSGSQERWGPNDGFGGLAPIPTKFVQLPRWEHLGGYANGAYWFQQGAWRSWSFR
jgi:hypothetical protein